MTIPISSEFSNPSSIFDVQNEPTNPTDQTPKENLGGKNLETDTKKEESKSKSNEFQKSSDNEGEDSENQDQVHSFFNSKETEESKSAMSDIEIKNQDIFEKPRQK